MLKLKLEVALLCFKKMKEKALKGEQTKIKAEFIPPNFILQMIGYYFMRSSLYDITSNYTVNVYKLNDYGLKVIDKVFTTPFFNKAVFSELIPIYNPSIHGCNHEKVIDIEPPCMTCGTYGYLKDASIHENTLMNTPPLYSPRRHLSENHHVTCPACQSFTCVKCKLSFKNYEDIPLCENIKKRKIKK